MKRILVLFYILGFSISCQTELRNVTIKVFSENLDPSTNVYISGNDHQLGNWKPNVTPLKRGDNNWEGNFKLKLNTFVEFKFTAGSWESEALDDSGNIPGNHQLIVTKDTTLYYFVNFWNDGNTSIQLNGQITGNVVYHEQISYEGILSRDIVVWLPPGYENYSTKNYPVLYMNDGQNIFNPSTSYTKIDWQMDEAADSLIKKSKIEPLIIVGINNTRDRKEEYSSTGKGIKYMQFIVTKLKPFIDSTYRTLPDRSNTAIGGSSMGGLASFMLAWNYSSYFSKVICFSPAFKYDNFDYTEKIMRYSGKKKNLDVFIYNGGLNTDIILQSGVDLMINALISKGFVKNENLFVFIDSAAEHNENSWAKQIPKVLDLFYRKGSLDEKYNNKSIK